MNCTARAQVDEIVRRIMEENELEKLARMQKQQETKEYSTHPPPFIAALSSTHQLPGLPRSSL